MTYWYASKGLHAFLIKNTVVEILLAGLKKKKKRTKKIHPRQALSVCFVFYPALSGGWHEEANTHIDENQIIFFILTFHVYSSTMIQVRKKKSMYTSSLSPFTLRQFIFTKHIHTYLIDKYIMQQLFPQRFELFMVTHARHSNE